MMQNIKITDRLLLNKLNNDIPILSFFSTETEWWHHCKWYDGGGKSGGDPDLCDRWHRRGPLRGAGK